MLTHTIRPRRTIVSPCLRVGLALVLLGLFAGCYAYVPILGEDPAPGEEVRLRLTAPAAMELSDWVGQPVRSVEGPVLAITPDSLLVDVGWRALYAGTPFEGRRDNLYFHRSQILEVDRKQFSWTRTGLVAAGFAATAALAVRAIRGSGSPSDPRDIDPRPF